MFSSRAKKIFKVLGFSVASVALILFVGIFILIFFAFRSSRNSASPVSSISSKAVAAESKALPIPKNSAVTGVQSEEKMAQAQKEDYSKIFAQVKKYRKYFDGINSDLSQSAAPHLCDILCDHSQLEPDVKVNFQKFYNEEGRRAFDDPAFRLELKAIQFSLGIFTPTLMEAARELEEVDLDQMAASNQLLQILEFEARLMPKFYTVYSEIKDLHAKENQFRLIVKLRKQCGNRSAEELIAECRMLNFEGEEN